MKHCNNIALQMMKKEISKYTQKISKTNRQRIKK